LGLIWVNVYFLSTITCVILRSIRPPTDKFTVEPEIVTFTLDKPWSELSQLYVWRTQFAWDGMTQLNSTFFEQLAPINIIDGSFTLSVNPDELYTLTTLSTGNRATIPPPPPNTPFPQHYSDNFDQYQVNSEAQYFADQAGSFEIFATNSSRGNVMRQSVPTLPICWEGDYAPYSVIGDVTWSDTFVSADVMIEVSFNTFSLAF
jgi:galactosylceramidase